MKAAPNLQPSAGAITLRDDGFTLELGEGKSLSVPWSDVGGIAAWKRDCGTSDEICVGFRTSAEQQYIVVSETAEGYSLLLAEVERRFPDRNETWWNQTAFPAFARCWTIIWGDAPEPAACPRCAADISGVREEQCPGCAAQLVTVRCATCSGAGKTWERKWWLGGAAVAAVAALALWVAIRAGWLAADWTGQAGAGACALFAGCVLMLVFAWRDRGVDCVRCEGTGWWDPRGRAQRKIPASASAAGSRDGSA